MGIFDAFVSAAQGMANYGLQQDAINNNYELGIKNFNETRRTNELNYELAVDTANKNFALQQGAYDWAKYAQQNTWAREDNAIQRRAADLQAAGLSKTLAAGGAAQASSPVHIEAPQMATPQKATVSGSDIPQKGVAQMADIGAIVRAAMTQDINFRQSQADIKLTEQQTKRVAEERKGLEIDNQVKEDTASANIDSVIKQNMITGWNVNKAQLDNTLKSLELDQKTVDLIRSRIKLVVDQKYALSSEEVDILAKQMAIKEAAYNLSLSSDIGLRTTDSQNSLLKAGNQASSQYGRGSQYETDGLIQKVADWVDSIRKAKQQENAYKSRSNTPGGAR